MNKESCEAAKSAAGAALRMARLNCYIFLEKRFGKTCKPTRYMVRLTYRYCYIERKGAAWNS